MSVLFENRTGAGRPKRSRLTATDEKRISAPASSGKRILALALGVVAVALILPSYANAAYGWPIKPFNQQHPVRGQLNDPRMNGDTFDSSTSFTFHSGIDIATPDGTAVYAVTPGRVHYLDPSAIAVRRAGVAVVFEYWHIIPVVKNRALVKRHELLGYVELGRGHVHFAQKENGSYVNPLRRGGLTPYTDTKPPTIKSISYYTGGVSRDLNSAVVSGEIRIIVNAYDTPQLSSNWPQAVVTPAWIGWQLFDARGLMVEHKHRDFGRKLYFVKAADIFAPGTLKNGIKRGLFVAGNYNYWVGPERNTTRVEGGAYRLVVTVADVRDNQTTETVYFTVANTADGAMISALRGRASR
jgi:hypothetical protein